MQYFLPEYIKLQSELVQRWTFFWLIYLQTSRHATQMNWINTKVKCIVHMGLSKVKVLRMRKPVVSQWPIRMLYSGKQKRFIILIFCITKFKHMFVHSAWTHGAILELKKRRKKIQDLLDFNQKMGKTVAAKLVLTFLPYRLWTCHLFFFFVREVDLLPTRAEVYDISWVLHCFDVALPNQHFTYWWFFKS